MTPENKASNSLRTANTCDPTAPTPGREVWFVAIAPPPHRQAIREMEINTLGQVRIKAVPAASRPPSWEGRPSPGNLQGFPASPRSP